MALKKKVAKAVSPAVAQKKSVVKGKLKAKPVTEKVNTPQVSPDDSPKVNVNKATLQREKVSEGVNALFGSLKHLDAEKRDLFDSDPELIALQVAAVKIPQSEQHPIKTSLKHPIRNEDSEICLIVKDLEKGLRVDHEPTVAHFKQFLSEKGLDGISEVISLRQLKVEYKAYEAKSKFAKRFDVVLVDSRILRLIPTFLGKPFYQMGKLPVPFNMKAKDLKKELESALSVTYLPMTNKGSCSQVHVGHTKQTAEEVTDNIVSVCESLEKNYPGGFKNIRSLNLRPGNRDLVIPLFISLETRDAIQLPVVTKEESFVEDELSTIAPGKKVRVYKNGRVEVIEDESYTPGPLDKVSSKARIEPGVEESMDEGEDEEELDEEDEAEEDKDSALESDDEVEEPKKPQKNQQQKKKQEEVSDEESSDEDDFEEVEQAHMKRRAMEDVQQQKKTKKSKKKQVEESEEEEEEPPKKQLKKAAKKKVPTPQKKQKQIARKIKK